MREVNDYILNIVHKLNYKTLTSRTFDKQFKNPRLMKIALIVIGKTDAGYFVQALEEYKKRLVHYIPFEMTVIPDIKNTKNLSESQQKEKEGELILKALQPGDFVVLLDEKGKEYTSMEFASYIEKKTHTVSKRLVFVVRGPYGFSQDVYDAAAQKISLSRMTFSHQMIRLIFVEQIYRAMTILNNEPYHHE
jgi:23S rRNA (pseudouridine1915-N3)-methyltransferase